MSRIRRFRETFFATPRWYSYGGMIQSIFLAVNLAKYYGKRVVFFYPKNHFDRRYNYPGFLNRELAQIVVDNVVLGSDSLLQKLGSKCLEFNRWVYRSKNLVAGAIRRMLRLLGWKLPIFWGYCGLEESRSISRSFRSVISRVKPEADVKIFLDTNFDAEAINRSADTEGLPNATRVINGMQTLGYVITPWSFAQIQL